MTRAASLWALLLLAEPLAAQETCDLNGRCQLRGQALGGAQSGAQLPSGGGKGEQTDAQPPYLTNEQFDAELDALRARLAKDKHRGAARIRAQIQQVHDEFHGQDHASKIVDRKRPPPGGVLVEKAEMGMFERTIEAHGQMKRAEFLLRRGRATAQEVAKAAAKYEQAMNEFMNDKASLLHNAYHKTFKKDPDGDNGLDGTSPGYQDDHNRRMRDSDPTNPFPLIFSGNAALADGSPAAALAFANQALALDPRNSEGYSLRAAARMDLKDYPGASEDAKTALELDPQDKRSQAVTLLAHDRVAGGFSVKKPAAAGAGAEASGVSFGPASSGGALATKSAALQSSVLARQTERAIAMGDYQAAVAQASRAINLDASNAGAFSLRAIARLRAREHDEALEDAAQALSLDADNAAAHNVKMSALNRMGDHRAALAAAEAAIAANPKNAYAYYMKAMALEALGDREGMRAALAQAAALDPRYAEALEIARQAPDDEDLGFLFPEEQLAAAQAALARGRRAPRGRASMIGMVVGVALVLFGLAHVLLGGLPAAVKTALARAARGGPAVGRSETVVGLPTPAPLSGAQPSLLSGQYRPLRALGAGARGEVFEALDVTLDRRVAIRRLPAPLRAEDRARLLGPARQAALLSHPGIAGLYSILEEADAIYLIVELAEGKTLEGLLAQGGTLPPSKALPLFRKAAEALDYAHARGAVHGAIRPSNIVVGSDGQPKLVDFGLASSGKGKAADLQDFSSCLRQALGLGALSVPRQPLSASALVDAAPGADRPSLS